MSVVALVPMRHHSARVAGKNYRRLGGVPLYHHVVRTLARCPDIDEIVESHLKNGRVVQRLLVPPHLGR